MIGSRLVTLIHRHARPGGPVERGQSLVEFALVLPVFMLLVFGILDGGRAILAYNEVSQSTRNVARVASVSCFDTATRCSTASGTPIGNAMAGQIGTSGPITWTVTCIDPDTERDRHELHGWRHHPRARGRQRHVGHPSHRPGAGRHGRGRRDQ